MDDDGTNLLQAAIPIPTSAMVLPFEILSYMFILSIESDTSRDSGCESESKPSLARVCSHWRRVALATPRLWTRIYIYSCSSSITSAFRHFTQFFIDDLRQFDLRAARFCLPLCSPSLPLELHIRWAEFGPELGEDRDSFNELITPYSTRWSLVDLQLFIQAVGVAFIARKMKDFSALTELKVSLPTSTPDGFQEFDQDGLFGPPIYASLPHLLHLSLDFGAFVDAPLGAAIAILKTFTLPSLSVFALILYTDIFEESEAIWDLFVSLLQRSNVPPLRIIHSPFGCYPSDPLIPNLLKYTPHLEEASNLFLGQAALAELISGSVKMAPRLKEIFIFEASPDDMDAILRMLVSRWEGGKGLLEKLTLRGCDVLFRRVRDELKGLEVIRLE